MSKTKTNLATKPRAAGSADRDQARRVLQAEAQAVLNVIDQLDESFDRAVQMIVDLKGSVIVSGTGKSGLIGQKISATFASIGTPSHFLNPTDAMHGDLGRIRADDLLLLLSHGGETEEVLALAAVIRQDKVPVISITGKSDSHLARISDVHLSIGDVTEACPHNLAPTASTTATLALGDALAIAVSQRKAFTSEDYQKRHPGGLLGRQMMPLTQALRLRVGENLPLLSEKLSVEQVLAQRGGERRVGAVLLVDEKGRLAGIFTDADLAKLLVREGPAALKRPIRQVMTATPRCLPEDACVRDAVQMVREMRLDEIPVVDADRRPIGLVDVLDLIALKVIEE